MKFIAIQEWPTIEQAQARKEEIIRALNDDDPEVREPFQTAIDDFIDMVEKYHIFENVILIYVELFICAYVTRILKYIEADRLNNSLSTISESDKLEGVMNMEVVVNKICNALQDHDLSIKDGCAALDYAKAAIQKSSKCKAEPFDLAKFL